MKQKLCLLLMVFLYIYFVPSTSPVRGGTMEEAQSLRIHSPDKALISPVSARLSISQEILISERQGARIVEFLLPEDSDNLQIQIPGQTIVRWNSEPFILADKKTALSQRDKILQESIQLKGQLTAIKTRLEVWKTQTGAATAEELEKRQSLMQEEIPQLAIRQNEVERKIALLEKELSMIPETALLGQKITVTLNDNLANNKSIKINYTYDTRKCGWQPLYNFDANIDSGREESVNVTLLAEVWQYSGIDWKDAEIILATQGLGKREPAPLPKWIVGKQPPQNPEPRLLSMNYSQKRATSGAEVAATMEDAIPVSAPVFSDTESLYATWSLSAKGLPEGKSTVFLGQDEWKTPMQWLARPTREDNRVWLFVKYDLPPDQAWPAGAAQFGINGQNIGSGGFMPKSREVTLYFGADPRVNVRTTIDTDRQGETGFINTNKTWTGAWTYTISNQHDRNIKVKVERPAPQIANEQISVSYKDNPKATLEEKEHLLFWNIEVPSHSAREIQHSIIISSPEKLPLFPAVP